MEVGQQFAGRLQLGAQVPRLVVCPQAHGEDEDGSHEALERREVLVHHEPGSEDDVEHGDHHDDDHPCANTVVFLDVEVHLALLSCRPRRATGLRTGVQAEQYYIILMHINQYPYACVRAWVPYTNTYRSGITDKETDDDIRAAPSTPAKGVEAIALQLPTGGGSPPRHHQLGWCIPPQVVKRPRR